MTSEEYEKLRVRMCERDERVEKATDGAFQVFVGLNITASEAESAIDRLQRRLDRAKGKTILTAEH